MNQRPQGREEAFVVFLHGLKGDRGALAALRRGLGKAPGEAYEGYRYVVPWLHDDDDRWQEVYFYLVAALFASYSDGGWPATEDGTPTATNLGASFARLAHADKEGAKGVERRFTALLASKREDMPTRLRHAISLLKAHAAPVDWARLLRDLQAWDHEDRRVQRRWARAFWRSSDRETSAASQPSEAVTS